MISSPIWQISPKGITNSFSRPRKPQTQPGPGTMIARILPVHGSTSRSPTNPSRLQSQTLITSRLFNSLIRIASSPGLKHFMYPINSVLIVQTAVHESYSLYIVYVPILVFEMSVRHYFLYFTVQYSPAVFPLPSKSSPHFSTTCLPFHCPRSCCP